MPSVRGAPAHCCGTSPQRAAEAALRHSEHVLRQLIATSNDAFIAMDVAGWIREWNRQAEVIFGWTAEEAIGRQLVNTIIPPSYRDAHRIGLARYLATGDGTVSGQRLEVEGRRRDGAEVPVELTIWALGSGRDVAFNALGLHNRRAFGLLAEQAIKEAVRAGRPVIGVFVDVDRLKHINADEVAGIEGRLRDRVAVAAGAVVFPLTVSIGVAHCLPGEECDLTDLFERADQAMYEEKRSKYPADTPLAGPADKG